MSQIDQRLLNARMPAAKNIMLLLIASLFVIIGTPLLWLSGSILNVYARLFASVTRRNHRTSIPVLNLKSR